MVLAMNRLRGTPVAVAVGLLASGCGTGLSSLVTKSPPPSPPTSTHLATLLVAPATLGKGFVVDADDDLDSSVDVPSQILDAKLADCSKMLLADWMLNAGSGESFAFRMYKNGDTQEVAEQLENFESPDTAQSFMKNIRQLATVCTGHAIDVETQSTVTFRGEAVSALGDEAYAITGTDASWESGETLEAVRVGDVVVTTFAVNRTAKDNGAGLAAEALTDAAAKLKSAA